MEFHSRLLMLSQQCIQTVQVDFILVVISANQDFSKDSSITTGVLQGDTLAPFLFIIVVDCILQQTDDSPGLKTHAENPEEYLPDLDFTNIIVLLDETDTAAAAEHYDNLQNSASKVALRINKDNTKIMHINYCREGAPPKLLGGLKVVEDFKYLGTQIASSLSDFHQRRGIAWRSTS